MKLTLLATAMVVVSCRSAPEETARIPAKVPVSVEGAPGHTHGHGADHTHGPLPGHSYDGSIGCVCAEARLTNAWCGEHAVGYVAGQPIASRVLFDALDAHGHELDRDVMQCETCKAMMDAGGFCEDCRFGWFGGQAYMSRITYSMALGEVRDVEALSCESCRDQAGDVGWCTACGGGWAGNVYFVDRGLYAEAAREFRRLEAAIDASLRCETCAQVILVDGTCPYCRIRYERGVAVTENE